MEKIKFPTELEVRRVCNHVDLLYLHDKEEYTDAISSPCEKCREWSYGDEIIRPSIKKRGRPRKEKA
jgi:hypothetical protein